MLINYHLKQYVIVINQWCMACVVRESNRNQNCLDNIPPSLLQKMADEVKHIEKSKLLIDSDDKSKDSSDAQSKFLYLSSLVAAFGFFTLGYDIGSISGSMIFITEEFSLTFFWHELLVSMAIGPAIFGALFSGYFNDAIGRKLTFIMAAIVFIAGSLIMACAYSINMLLFGRILTGISYGKIVLSCTKREGLG